MSTILPELRQFREDKKVVRRASRIINSHLIGCHGVIPIRELLDAHARVTSHYPTGLAFKTGDNEDFYMQKQGLAYMLKSAPATSPRPEDVVHHGRLVGIDNLYFVVIRPGFGTRRYAQLAYIDKSHLHYMTHPTTGEVQPGVQTVVNKLASRAWWLVPRMVSHYEKLVSLSDELVFIDENGKQQRRKVGKLKNVNKNTVATVLKP